MSKQAWLKVDGGTWKRKDDPYWSTFHCYMPGTIRPLCGRGRLDEEDDGIIGTSESHDHNQCRKCRTCAENRGIVSHEAPEPTQPAPWDELTPAEAVDYVENLLYQEHREAAEDCLRQYWDPPEGMDVMTYLRKLSAVPEECPVCDHTWLSHSMEGLVAHTSELKGEERTGMLNWLYENWNVLGPFQSGRCSVCHRSWDIHSSGEVVDCFVAVVREPGHSPETSSEEESLQDKTTRAQMEELRRLVIANDLNEVLEEEDAAVDTKIQQVLDEETEHLQDQVEAMKMRCDGYRDDIRMLLDGLRDIQGVLYGLTDGSVPPRDKCSLRIMVSYIESLAESISLEEVDG